jgi:outer membrane lipoprotein-sorting protein
MKILAVVTAMIFLFAVGAMAETTNDLSDAEIQGRNLARQLLEQRPTENLTNTGVLKIRDGKGKTSEIPMRCETVAKATSWKISYIADLSEQNTNEWHTRLNIIGVEHFDLLPNQYENTLWTEDGIKSNGVATVVFTKDSKGMPEMLGAVRSDSTFYLYGEKIMAPFVGSDFWIADLGLEFFHWPEQKILKKENRRSRACNVLESTNPNPSTNGYSRVVSWIDEESLGVVEARAYDAQGKLLKEFYPKDFKKVDGQWQLGMMEMDNVQTGSRSRIEFDLKK